MHRVKFQHMRYSAGIVSPTIIGYQKDLFTYYLIFMWRQCQASDYKDQGREERVVDMTGGLLPSLSHSY